MTFLKTNRSMDPRSTESKFELISFTWSPVWFWIFHSKGSSILALQSRWGWGALFYFPAFSSFSRFLLLCRLFFFELIDWKYMMIHTLPYDSKLWSIPRDTSHRTFRLTKNVCKTWDEKIILNREMWKKRLSNQWLNTDNECASNETPGGNENCPNSKFYLSK